MAATKRGFPPGAHLRGGEAGGRANAEYARLFYAPVLPVVASLAAKGLSLRGIARELERQGLKTRQGRTFGPVQVRRVLQRAAMAQNDTEIDRSEPQPQPGLPACVTPDPEPAESEKPSDDQREILKLRGLLGWS